jgi:hypothetical protein
MYEAIASWVNNPLYNYLVALFYFTTMIRILG